MAKLQLQQQQELLEKILTVDESQRAQLITQINDVVLRQHIQDVINDQQTITQFFNPADISAAAGTQQSADELKSGARINRLTIEKLLGRGGMGSVYQGYDEKLKRKVAIKSIRSEYLSLESTHQRFIREAQILSKINHPAICHIYDYIETKSRDYLVLELVQGKQLNETFLDDSELLDVCLELTRGLVAAHAHGIVHRDLKPDNIMITKDNKVKILDFGIAQSISQAQTRKPKKSAENEDKDNSEITQHGSIVGTIRYMSPEQARGENLTTASDLYSLGVIMHELFSHENAYDSMQTGTLLESVQQGKVAKLNTHFKPIKPLIAQLCQADASKRPTAVQVCVELEKIIQAPKNRRKRILQLIVLVFVGLLLAIMLWQWNKSRWQQNSAELAKNYNNSINQLVREAEQIYVLPLHNTKDEINQILAKGTQLYVQIENDANLTEKDKLQLQGLIYLESEDYLSAVDYLQRSQASDFLLARAYIGLYINKASEHSFIYGIDEALADADLRDKYLAPAIYHIDNSTEKNAVHQAFKVALTESIQQGIILLDEIIQAKSWDKNAIELKIQLLSTQAERAVQQGDWETAKKFYQQTSQTFEQAIDMARSYPDNYSSLCQVNTLMLTDGIQRTGENSDLQAQTAIAACENYLITYPQDTYVINLLARIHIILAQGQLMLNKNPQQSLQMANDWIEQSNTIDVDYRANWNAALVHSIKASYAMTQGDLDDSHINQAISLYQKTLFLAPATQIYMSSDWLYAYSLQADWLSRNKRDPIVAVAQAELIFQQSLKNPLLMLNQKHALYENMAAVYLVKLAYDYLHGHDIIDQAEKILNLYQQAKNPLLVEPNIHMNIASIYLLMAEYQQHNNKTDVQRYLTLATQNLDQARSVNPQNTALLLSDLWLKSMWAYHLHEQQLKLETEFELMQTKLAENTQIWYLWANYYFLISLNSDNPSEKIRLKKLALEKIKLALNTDSTHPLYLHVLAKLQTQ